MVASWYIRRDLDGTLVLDDRIHRMPAEQHVRRDRVAPARRQSLSETHLTYTRLEWHPPHHVLAHHRDAAGISQDPLEPPQACPSDAVAASPPPTALGALRRLSLACQIWAGLRPEGSVVSLSHAKYYGSMRGESAATTEIWRRGKRVAGCRVHAWSSCSDDAACARPFGQARRRRPISQN